MAVRVRLSFRTDAGRSVETVAVLNGGFETDAPCLLLPAGAAAQLFGAPLPEGRQVAAEVAGGEATFVALEETAEGRVKTADRDGPSVRFDVIVSDRDREALVSDSGIDGLGVLVLGFARGLWCFAGEDRARSSETPRFWQPG